MEQILLIVLLVVAVALVGIILLQQGKGAGMGASFGAGASGTVFGAPGSGNVLTKMTTILAILFFLVALGLGYIAANRDDGKPKDLIDSLAAESEAAAAKVETTGLPVDAAQSETGLVEDKAPVSGDDAAAPVIKEEKPPQATEEKAGQEKSTKEEDKATGDKASDDNDKKDGN